MPNQTSSQPSSSSSPGDFSHHVTHNSSRFAMRVFLIQTAKGLFSSSGGYRANICLLRYLASRGHSVCQICYSYHDEVETYVHETSTSSGRAINSRTKILRLSGKDGSPDADVKMDQLIMNDGVEIVALESEAFDRAFGGEENMQREIVEYIEGGQLSARLSDFVSFLQEEIRLFSPTHIICNDGLSMQASSAQQMPDLKVCRVSVIHTAEQLPFGPFAGGIPGSAYSPREYGLLGQLDGIWSVSNAIKRYALEHGQLQSNAFPHHPWTYLEQKKHEIPEQCDNWDKKFIGMINPCEAKGLQILVGLSKACPQFAFLVYKSWGFDDKVDKQLNELQNITVRPAVADMEKAWHDIKLLLVPSLWYEAWGIVVIEAHLRGIPVISSDAGALPEAMLGLDYIVPVNTVDGKRDEEGDYIVPKQDIAPWAVTVNRLMTSKYEYEKLSREVRNKTTRWLRNMDEATLENWLIGLMVSSNKHKAF